jgi:hypothetical protein
MKECKLLTHFFFPVKLLLEKDFRNFHAAKDKKSILLKKQDKDRNVGSRWFGLRPTKKY